MRLKVNDIFTIRISDNEVGFGQILAFPIKPSLLIIVFDLKQKIGDSFDFEMILNSRILFLGHTLDGKLYNKHWHLIGNVAARNVEFPYHKLGSPPGDLFITDYTSKKIRSCSVEEFDMFDYKKIIAPVRYENALKAYYGYQDWIPEDYDEILYERTLKSVKTFRELK